MDKSRLKGKWCDTAPRQERAWGAGGNAEDRTRNQGSQKSVSPGDSVKTRRSIPSVRGLKQASWGRQGSEQWLPRGEWD